MTLEFKMYTEKKDGQVTYDFKLENIESAARPVDVPMDMKFITLIIGNRGVAGLMTPESFTLQKTQESQIMNVEILSSETMARRVDVPERYKPCIIKFDLVDEMKTEGFLVYLEEHHMNDLMENIK